VKVCGDTDTQDFAKVLLSIGGYCRNQMIHDPISLAIGLFIKADAMNCKVNTVSAVVDSYADFDCSIGFFLDCYAAPKFL
jgi:hypothetical protein